jgi:NNP family nitrate/nitrite transporter-like MFS transporter
MSETRNGSSRNLALATTAFLLCFSAWGMLAPIAPKLEDKLGLSNTQTAVMIALPVVLGSLLRIPLGVFTDRYGGRKVFTAMLLYCAFPPLLVGFADSYTMLLVAGFLLGVSGAAFAVGVPFVSEWYPPERQGQALGLYGIGTAGTAISAWTMPAIREGLGQEAAGIIYSLVLLAFALVWTSAARNAPDHRPRSTPYGKVIRSGWTLWQLALFYFVAFGGFVAMSIYLPKLLTDWFDYSQTSAGARAAGFVVVAALVARPLGGRWSDRFGGYRVLSVTYFGVGLCAIGLSWQASDPTIVPVTIFCLSMAFFLGMGAGAVFKLVPTHFPETKGAVTGIVGAAGGLGGFFPPLVMGFVKDATDEYVMGFVFLVAFAWMCAGQALSLAARPRRAEAAAGSGR